MDHVASWRLIHRSEDDILSLAPAAEGSATSVRRDVSGLALLASVNAGWTRGLRTA